MLVNEGCDLAIAFTLLQVDRGEHDGGRRISCD
jgi:hypothetical protein